MGWSLVSFIRFKGFIPDYLSRGWADTRLHPFLVSISINCRELLERSGKDVKWKSAYVDDFKTSWFE